VTNYPYIQGTTKEADAVVCNFSGSPDSIRISADLLFGAVAPYPSTKMPVTLPKETEPPQKASAPKKTTGKKPAAKKPAKKGFAFGGKC